MPLPKCRPGFTDHIFKTAAGVQLPLRVWPPAKPPGPSAANSPSPEQKGAPWLLWIHGGGYTCGKWSAPTSWVSSAFGDRGYGVVSVGYRLQPQASMLDMIEDCVDAAAWCHGHVSPLGLNPDRWAVGGASSGATLAAMVALRTAYKPRAFVNVYGLLDTEHYLDDEAGRAPPPDEYVVSNDAELAELVRDVDPANAVVQNPWASEMPPSVSLEEARAAFGLPEWEPTRAQFVRSDLYSYVAKNRNLMEIVYRRSKFGTDHAFREHVRAHSPYHVLQGRETFPPTFFMHGTSDSIVPVVQSWKFAERLVEMDVDIAEVYDEGKDHAYDIGFEPGDEGWDKNVEACMAFVDRHLK
ncbi:hypothetical protein CspeluHIS016_0600440 [Cutaneotrichosporon spelunceum]|uniref:Alpha/beta-hydrolase n=1 Tax=Cutaneotrichosporon spelunceum TaxID=1672016 RepID=A0AAD3TY95_9TREE|nr:hypothetical protein CspeluHIS016_0600440 [Cutaneotrichosporon spelunceum]